MGMDHGSESPCNRLNLLTEIRNLLQQKQQEEGVNLVLAGIDRHLDHYRHRHPMVGTLPDERKELLKSAIAAITDDSLQSLARMIATTQEQLIWKVDTGHYYDLEDDVGQGYISGNMHTELIGPNGCIFYDENFSIGLFMLDSCTLYRDHNHDSPELYFNLTGPSGWRFDQGPWVELDAGSTVWNPSGRVHATRVYHHPFFAIFSWTDCSGGICKVIQATDWSEIEQKLNGVQDGQL
ncbi:MAG: hypothetical protein GKR95_04275 [Gammaproteobacteria bacterium]|nr:hypothetical protein [Gammaproteobacteria bacterium]